jgi:hypothetical protein
MNKIQILAQIEAVGLNTEVDVGNLGDTYYQTVRFTQEGFTSDYETRGKYSWIAKCNSNYSHRTIFPTRGNYVLFFKTLKGAKKNFLRRYEDERI